MKKIFLSSIVIIAFIGYSIYQRIFIQPQIPVIPPKNISKAPITATNSPIPSAYPSALPTAAQSPVESATSIPTAIPTQAPTPSSGYKDGTYTGDPEDAFYGTIQVQAVVTSGKITNIQFLQYPNDRGTSIAINSQADPMLAQEAIQSQNANVNIISGATDSSNAFNQSLQSALVKAKI